MALRPVRRDNQIVRFLQYLFRVTAEIWVIIH